MLRRLNLRAKARDGFGACTLAPFMWHCQNWRGQFTNIYLSSPPQVPETVLVKRVSIYDAPVPVRPAVDGLIYATRPLVTEATDGQRYYFKGPDPAIVFAELVGYNLARILGLRVPDCALCKFPGTDEQWFASAAIRLRSGIETRINKAYSQHVQFLQYCGAIDVWIFNCDRNGGNVIADPIEAGHVNLVAIDFERADALRGVSQFEIEAKAPLETLPKGSLANVLDGVPFPAEACDKIAGIESLLAPLVDRLSHAIHPEGIFHAETVSACLIARCRRIHSLVREVWNV